MHQLLPPNRTALEAALADARAGKLDPRPLAYLADSSRCPKSFLPWLAWSLAVEGWDETLDETKRRALIRNSIAIHKRKGTAGSVRRALDSLGIKVEFKEWQSLPGAAPYTFLLTAWVNDNLGDGLLASSQLHERIRRVVDATRNVRSHYTLRIGARFDNQLYLAGGLQLMTQVSHSACADAKVQVGHHLRASTSLQVLPQLKLTLKASL
ncbi:phage tail protein I [Chitinimonas sp. PSY-7]|uniref:phage tail protein I n=1 Tax=Chitinimonas sp. PSY-7 TaxID=3459088 RepID=UPI00403FDAAC